MGRGNTQSVMEAVLTCECGDRGCDKCRALLSEVDVKIAAFEECAQIAEAAGLEYSRGNINRAMAEHVARRIRAEMAHIQEFGA